MKLPRIGYLVNTYPRPSHSFIRREIAAVERFGFFVHRFAMRGELEALHDPADLAEHEKTERILEAGPVKLAGRLLRQTLQRPGAMLRSVRLAWRRSRAGESSFPRQLIYLIEGASVAIRAKELGLSHIHAHFGTNSARVAAYSYLLGGPRYSFTVHGPEEFDSPQALDLGGKVHDSHFCAAISSFGRSQLYRWTEAEAWPKVKVVHCGIEMGNWPEPVAMPANDTLRMVAIGRFAEQKGFGLLIQGFAQAYRQNPKLHLSLVGDGPLRPQIEQMLQKEGITHAVELLGWQAEDGVRRALGDSHLLVVPSFAEGLPVVIMEAMASARPCIATYIAGVPELVRPGQEGWLIPSGDIDALSQAMLDAAAAPIEALRQMGLDARQRVTERHDIEVSAHKLARLFIS
ncbi:glycosyltransferase [Paracoccus sp. (in: a-proteobacteria)]|uniref:glycosyltransferase n=1 Tax=Paracoccus sp. TaxID=267 RepID=UPI002898D894|nr:glycosyltransferase [Paracoccus sp. (in: a-proteobacteria)]